MLDVNSKNNLWNPKRLRGVATINTYYKKNPDDSLHIWRFLWWFFGNIFETKYAGITVDIRNGISRKNNHSEPVDKIIKQVKQVNKVVAVPNDDTKRMRGNSFLVATLTVMKTEAWTPASFWPPPPPTPPSTCQNMEHLTKKLKSNYYYELDLLPSESSMRINIGQLNHDQKYDFTKVLSLNIKNMTCGPTTTISDQKMVRKSLKKFKFKFQNPYHCLAPKKK